VKLLTEVGLVLRGIGKLLTGLVLIWLLLAMVDIAFGGLSFIDRLATALIGQGVLGYYGLGAGVTMLALTASKVWGMIEFSADRIRRDDVIGALSAIVGRGLRRGISAFLEIIVGGIAWPVTALGWIGTRSEARDREKLAEAREYQTLRLEIDEARRTERLPGNADREPERRDSSLQERHRDRARMR